MRIYTKGGDKGQTSLIGGSRVYKNNIRIEAYGTIDELNAQLGLWHDMLHAHEQLQGLTLAPLQKIQNNLFVLGALLACEDDEFIHKLPQLPNNACKELEQAIDEMTKELEPLKYFVIPQGHITISQGHVVRTVCRRAERASVTLLQEISSELYQQNVQYLNRLADYIFVLTRYINKQLNLPETFWIPNA
jgi:cob(I)alamin adenosyltransferase